MHTHPDVDSYFIEYHPVQEIVADGDTLKLPGTESFPGIRHKTLDAIQYFLKDTRYTHVVRTNLSSFWILPRMVNKLRSCPNTDLYGGVLHDGGISGAGICMTRDVAEKLLSRKDIVYESGPGYFEWDDVSFARAIGHDTPRTPFGRFDMPFYQLFNNHITMFPTDCFHIRLKQVEESDRIVEGEMMMKLVTIFYTASHGSSMN